MADDEAREWSVLINDEEQYALFLAGPEPPPGWRPAGFEGSEEQCAHYVDEHWHDMRPLSLRRAHEG